FQEMRDHSGLPIANRKSKIANPGSSIANRKSKIANSMNILVIEDEPASRKLATLVLASGGHQVVDAPSAEEAVKTVHHAQPEIILLDLALPGMDGLALARQLKNDSNTRHIPIVAV